MAVSLSGLVGVKTDPVPTGFPTNNPRGEYYSVYVATGDPTRNKTDNFVIEVFVPHEDKEQFLKKVRRPRTCEIVTARLRERDGQIVFTTSIKNFIPLEVPKWYR